MDKIRIVEKKLKYIRGIRIIPKVNNSIKISKLASIQPTYFLASS